MKRRTGLGVAIAAALAAPAAVAGPGDEPIPDRVQVRGYEFNLTVSKDKLVPGEVIINYLNTGEDPHDLRFQRLAPRGVQVGRERGVGALEPEEHVNIHAHLRKSTRYVLWCSLPDHRELGMEAVIRTRKHRRPHILAPSPDSSAG